MQTEPNTTGPTEKTTAQATDGSSDASTAAHPGNYTQPNTEPSPAVLLLTETECPRCQQPGVYRDKELNSFIHRDQMDGLRCGSRNASSSKTEGKKKASLGLMARIREALR